MCAAGNIVRRTLLGAALAVSLLGCGRDQPREEFPPITYEPEVQQDHVKDGILTSEPYEIEDTSEPYEIEDTAEPYEIKDEE